MLALTPPQDMNQDAAARSEPDAIAPPQNRSELANFIAAARAKGADDAFICQLLRSFGWPQREIERAYFVVYEEVVGLPIPAPQGGQGEGAKDTFFYLLSFVTLGIWSQALGEIGFILVNHTVPDSLSRSYGEPSFQIAFCLARLLVAYPVYLWMMRRILTDLALYREKAYSGVRKWLTYLALLVVALVAIGTLMAFLTSFLRGELTLRFLLKLLVILVIDGGILIYYSQWIQRQPVQA